MHLTHVTEPEDWNTLFNHFIHLIFKPSWNSREIKKLAYSSKQWLQVSFTQGVCHCYPKNRMSINQKKLAFPINWCPVISFLIGTCGLEQLRASGGLVVALVNRLVTVSHFGGLSNCYSVGLICTRYTYLLTDKLSMTHMHTSGNRTNRLMKVCEINDLAVQLKICQCYGTFYAF